jgi:hypothetical protein
LDSVAARREGAVAVALVSVLLVAVIAVLSLGDDPVGAASEPTIAITTVAINIVLVVTLFVVFPDHAVAAHMADPVDHVFEFTFKETHLAPHLVLAIGTSWCISVSAFIAIRFAFTVAAFFELFAGVVLSRYRRDTHG